jgi:toxin-antitoxin system PIN domain toxin
VIVVDLNLLLYAINRDSREHAAAKAWLEDVLSADEPVALPWIVLIGFIRLSTSNRVFRRALTTEQALDLVDSWLAQPPVIAVSPGERHWDILRDLLRRTGRAGDLATDAHLAAIAIENAAELCSTDTDFARFRALRWRNPIAE